MQREFDAIENKVGNNKLIHLNCFFNWELEFMFKLCFPIESLNKLQEAETGSNSPTLWRKQQMCQKEVTWVKCAI
jgi:hypothetical protein